jgi:hypothetical protein
MRYLGRDGTTLKRILREIGCKYGDWIHLAEGSVQFPAATLFTNEVVSIFHIRSYTTKADI